jgi:hypothetical protein
MTAADETRSKDVEAIRADTEEKISRAISNIRKTSDSDDDKLASVLVDLLAQQGNMTTWARSMAQKFELMAGMLENIPRMAIDAAREESRLSVERFKSRHETELRDGLAYAVFKERIIEVSKSGELTSEVMTDVATLAYEAANSFMSERECDSGNTDSDYRISYTEAVRFEKLKTLSGFAHEFAKQWYISIGDMTKPVKDAFADLTRVLREAGFDTSFIEEATRQ